MGSPNTTTPAARPMIQHAPRTRAGWRLGTELLTPPNCPLISLDSLSPSSGAPYALPHTPCWKSGLLGTPLATGWSETQSTHCPAPAHPMPGHGLCAGTRVLLSYMGAPCHLPPAVWVLCEQKAPQPSRCAPRSWMHGGAQRTVMWGSRWGSARQASPHPTVVIHICENKAKRPHFLLQGPW